MVVLPIQTQVKASSTINESPVHPIYTPQQIDGAPRPQLLRIDSRSALYRPGFPNPLLRPGQPRPPPPGGTPTPFIQRPPLPSRPPGPGQNVFQQNILGTTAPLNGTAPNVIRQAAPVQNVVRPPTPYQRPQGFGVRPQAQFQQRPVPAASPQRPPFNSYPEKRGQALDSTEVNSPQNVDNTDSTAAEGKGEVEKPALAAMKNRSFSVITSNVEPKAVIEDRRRSVSSIGSNEEEKRTPADAVNGKAQAEVYTRPESRTEMHMKKIEEDDNDAAASKKIPAEKPPTPTNKSAEDLSEKVTFNAPPSRPSTPASSQAKNRAPTPTANRSPTPTPNRSSTPSDATSPIPQQKSYNSSLEAEKSPIQSKQSVKKEHANVDKPGRRTPDSKASEIAKSKASKAEGDNDSGVDESTQGNDPLSNGDQSSPKKSTKSSTPRSATTPTKNKSFSRGSKSPNPKSPETPTSTTPGPAEKKIPMNKVQVGSAPSPNLKVVKSKIGSLDNASYKPGGGHVKIESRKIDFSSASSRISAKNEKYTPGGGDKKVAIQQQKLAWNAKSKIGSLENATHKPKGGDKKIETVKLDFKDKAKPKVGSKDNIKHTPGGGDVKIETKKLDIKVQSKVGSLDNIKHKPGGGDKKIFDDKDYLRQSSAQSNASLDGSQNSSQTDVREPVSDENLNRQH